MLLTVEARRWNSGPFIAIWRGATVYGDKPNGERFGWVLRIDENLDYHNTAEAVIPIGTWTRIGQPQ